MPKSVKAGCLNIPPPSFKKVLSFYRNNFYVKNFNLNYRYVKKLNKRAHNSVHKIIKFETKLN